MNSHSSLIWRVSLIYAALLLASLVVLGYFLAVAFRQQAASTLEAQRAQVQLAAAEFAPILSGPDGLTNPAVFEQLSLELSRAAGTRMTIFSADGLVLADSHRNLESVRAMTVTAGQPEINRDSIYIRHGPEPLSIAAPVFAGNELVGVRQPGNAKPGTTRTALWSSSCFWQSGAW